MKRLILANISFWEGLMLESIRNIASFLLPLEHNPSQVADSEVSAEDHFDSDQDDAGIKE